MRRPVLLALALLLAAAVAFFLLRQSDEGDGPPRSPTADESTSSPKRMRSEASPASAPGERSQSVEYDDDPAGPLRLEGQVLDETDDPVAGATVYLSSRPPREAVTEADGSFFFEGLIGRDYTLFARTEGRVANPIVYRLTESSDPAVLRLALGANLEVTVRSAESSEPIAGATVAFVDASSVSATTDDDGIARLANLPSGRQLIVAGKPGFASDRQLVAIPKTAGTTVKQEMRLSAGAAIAGRVVDGDGRPVQGASVAARLSGALINLVSARRDGVTTDARGRFRIEGAPRGRVSLVVAHPEYAPLSSDPISVAGDVDGVELELEPGGVVAGTVVGSDGSAVGWASVQVGPEPGTPSAEGGARHAVADESGAFRITGLARGAAVVAASSDTASSEIVAVNLAAKNKVENLKLVLSIEGMLAGTVVDDDGEPVAEAQVMASPDFWEGADLRELAVRGPSFATTDGGGRFEIRGLPDMRFRVRASRTPLMGENPLDAGVRATTGDTSLRLVVHRPGGVEGELRFSSGGTPEIATVAVAWASAVPVTRGRFRVDGLPPGNYDLRVRGPEFSSTIESGIEVRAGEVTDLGTVSVVRGRSFSGRVIDAGGAPVAGATVVVGKQIVGDGSSMTLDGLGGMLEEQFDLRRVKSDDSGMFRISGIGADKRVGAASHPELGRALAIEIPPGDTDVREDLQLLPVGSLRGKVTVNGDPGVGAQVIVSPKSGVAQLAVVETEADGTFAIAALSAGAYKVAATYGAMSSRSMAATEVTIQGGEESSVALDISEGEITVAVSVRGEAGASIDAAQVFLFAGRTSVKTGGELNKLFLSEDSASSAKVGFAFGDQPANFEGVAPGHYSICVIPINGDMNDPAFAEKLQRHVDTLAVHCRAELVDASPTEQSFTATVPPMQPLPEG